MHDTVMWFVPPVNEQVDIFVLILAGDLPVCMWLTSASSPVLYSLLLAILIFSREFVFQFQEAFSEHIGLRGAAIQGLAFFNSFYF